MHRNNSDSEDQAVDGNRSRKLTKSERDLAFKLKILAANIKIAVQMLVDHHEDVAWVLQMVRNSLESVPGLMSRETAETETNASMAINEKSDNLSSQIVPKKKPQA